MTHRRLELSVPNASVIGVAIGSQDSESKSVARHVAPSVLKTRFYATTPDPLTLTFKDTLDDSELGNPVSTMSPDVGAVVSFVQS